MDLGFACEAHSYEETRHPKSGIEIEDVSPDFWGWPELAKEAVDSRATSGPTTLAG